MRRLSINPYSLIRHSYSQISLGRLRRSFTSIISIDKYKCSIDLLFFTSHIVNEEFDEWNRFYVGGDIRSLMLQQQKFPLIGNDHGVDSEWFLLHVVERMLAIQILRLKGIDYNVEYREPLADIVEDNDDEPVLYDVAVPEVHIKKKKKK